MALLDMLLGSQAGMFGFQQPSALEEEEERRKRRRIPAPSVPQRQAIGWSPALAQARSKQRGFGVTPAGLGESAQGILDRLINPPLSPQVSEARQRMAQRGFGGPYTPVWQALVNPPLSPAVVEARQRMAQRGFGQLPGPRPPVPLPAGIPIDEEGAFVDTALGPVPRLPQLTMEPTTPRARIGPQGIEQMMGDVLGPQLAGLPPVAPRAPISHGPLQTLSTSLLYDLLGLPTPTGVPSFDALLRRLPGAVGMAKSMFQPLIAPGMRSAMRFALTPEQLSMLESRALPGAAALPSPMDVAPELAKPAGYAAGAAQAPESGLSALLDMLSQRLTATEVPTARVLRGTEEELVPIWGSSDNESTLNEMMVRRRLAERAALGLAPQMAEAQERSAQAMLSPIIAQSKQAEMAMAPQALQTRILEALLGGGMGEAPAAQSVLGRLGVYPSNEREAISQFLARQRTAPMLGLQNAKTPEDVFKVLGPRIDPEELAAILLQAYPNQQELMGQLRGPLWGDTLGPQRRRLLQILAGMRPEGAP